MPAGCCTRRRPDGTIDREVIDRAVRGQAVALSPVEFQLVCFRLKRERRWGLQQISAHTGYSRSHVAAALARQRQVGPR